MSDYTDTDTDTPRAAAEFDLITGLPALDSDFAALVPPGYTLHVWQPERARSYLEQGFQADNIASFCAYLGRYVTKPENLLITVDHDQRAFRGILDAAQDADSVGTNQHECNLQLKFSRDFAPLAAILDKPIAQDDFLNFLDQNGHLFLEAATLEQLVANFRATTVVKFTSVKNRDTGSYKFGVEADDQSTDEWKIPGEVTVLLPIFEGQEPKELKLKLRPIPKANTVTFTLVLPGFTKTVRDAVNAVRKTLLEWLDAQTASSTAGWTRATVLEGKIDVLGMLPAGWSDHKGQAIPSPIIQTVR